MSAHAECVSNNLVHDAKAVPSTDAPDGLVLDDGLTTCEERTAALAGITQNFASLKWLAYIAPMPGPHRDATIFK